ncbi:alkanesulfonates transport system permease protein [Corallococcus coralloides DSM 2259]|uniref:Alkanesulfonates transport system permease protein n=1 Tax=Corallococcus coralloides (strain ATCC 25202 / DSM 2259 / NBRC 100086 / M2) TaxID=1144275 RepID=H8MH37_CORCM|nr:alkanesulfonates transport system permease protein [Corallococcus coralloides DSM 2259]
MDPFAAPEAASAHPVREGNPHSRSGADPFSTPAPAPGRASREENVHLHSETDFFTETQPREAEAQDSPFRAAREELRLQGPVVTFPDGARIILGNEGGRPIHRGTVAVRGPCAPSREELMGSGLKEPQARALDFVLAWFGNPFDSVTSEPRSGAEPRWGVWPLSGPTLIAALAHWKQHEPEAFDAHLGRLGFEASALALFAQDPRLLAALARAGRERGAQRAQLETLVTHVLRPMLDSCAQEGTAVDAPGGLFVSARALALLFHAELRLGRRGVTRLVTLARERPEPPAAGERLAEDLRATGRSREASEVWRILTTPELADPS